MIRHNIPIPLIANMIRGIGYYSLNSYFSLYILYYNRLASLFHFFIS